MAHGIALFSGRFDPPNTGHLITIGWLLKKYSRVIVCVLDYPARKGCNVSVACDVFNTAFNLLIQNITYRSRISVVVNSKHFAYIDQEEILSICWNATGYKSINNVTYVGGNKEVNKHIKSLGCIEVEELPRVLLENNSMGTYVYSPKDQHMFESTRIRKKIDDGESLGEQYNIKV